MKQKRRDIKVSGSVRDLQHMRLMALLGELVRQREYSGTARVLEVDPRTVASNVKSGQLTPRVRDCLERALQHDVGSAADRQRERSDRLEARLDKLEGQVKGLRETLPSDLKRLRMSLDGVRKYYRVQRRRIERRLWALEAGSEGPETGATSGDGSRIPEFRSITPSGLHPREFKGPTLTELLEAEERSRMALEQDEEDAAHDANVSGATAGPEAPR